MSQERCDADPWPVVSTRQASVHATHEVGAARSGSTLIFIVPQEADDCLTVDGQNLACVFVSRLVTDIWSLPSQPLGFNIVSLPVPWPTPQLEWKQSCMLQPSPNDKLNIEVGGRNGGPRGDAAKPPVKEAIGTPTPNMQDCFHQL